jgi:hypothetical protein
MIDADLAQARKLAAEARQFAGRLDAAAEKLAQGALDGLHKDLRRVLDKAKLGKIDAVIGQKRKLEIEVQDMTLGRWPAELYGEMMEAGLIGDDEEVWPQEGEFWKDEYEGYR